MFLYFEANQNLSALNYTVLRWLKKKKANMYIRMYVCMWGVLRYTCTLILSSRSHLTVYVHVLFKSHTSMLITALFNDSLANFSAVPFKIQLQPPSLLKFPRQSMLFLNPYFLHFSFSLHTTTLHCSYINTIITYIPHIISTKNETCST